ncbi:hypothetical protein D6D01_10272 [Aureobasidium pullulans]|uniref:Myb-like domain-containing protein n=1 Tax=Aureobasidium pullulans TaxID=5580 RepID=A0A4S9JMJ5_AURPU|nr:hypothetical protein D6D01_10272 [Aureobasidium pullulans]
MIEQTAAQINALVTRDMIWLSDSSLPQPRVYCPTVAEIRETCRRSRELLRIQWGFPASPPPAAIVDNDDDYPSSDGGDESLVPDANSSVEDLSSSEDESDDDDVLPRRVAWKSPALPRIGTVGAGKGKGPSSVGIALAGAAEWQQEVTEDDDEEEEKKNDDEDEDEDDDDDYAPARPSRRAAGKQPARISAAPAPTVSSRKASSWSDAEDQACIKLMREICTEKRHAAIASTEKRFEMVADRMKQDHGFNRTASGVKLQWNRRLRAISGFEDRGEKKHSGSGLTTSSLAKGTKSGTLAATSLVASTASKGKTVSASPAQSSETSTTSVRQGKRKARFVDSEDEEDDFTPAARPSERYRSSSVIPSTQDKAFYDVSSENIITTPRSSRPKRTTTIEASDDEEITIRPSRKQHSNTTAPARSSRSKRATIIEDDDEEEEVTAAPRVSARSSHHKRRFTDINDEDEEQTSSAPGPKRHKMSDFSATARYSIKDGRLLTKSDTAWWNSKQHIVRRVNAVPASTPAPAPEPASESTNIGKAYWLGVLRRRQEANAMLREENARNQEDDSEDDEEPIVSTADKAKKNRELLRNKSSSAAKTSSRHFSPQLSDIAEQSENSVNEEPTENNVNEDNDYAGDAEDQENDTAAEDQDDASAAQLAADEELARKLQAEINGTARPRCGRGFN